MGRKAFKPTEEQRKLVEQMAAVGITHEQIAVVVGISADTLVKNFKDVLSVSAIKAGAAVRGALYRNAIKGNVTAQIFWCKTREGFREKDDIETKPNVTVVLHRGELPARLRAVDDENGNGTEG